MINLAAGAKAKQEIAPQPQAQQASEAPPGQGWEAEMRGMLNGLEDRFNKRMDTSDTGLHTRIEQVDKNLGTKIQVVSSDLESLKRRVADNERGLDRRIESVVSRINGAGPTNQPGVRPRPISAAPAPGASAQNTSYKEERYWRARRSLRLWPVKGADLKAALSNFLVGPLQMDPEVLNDVPSFEVRRVRATRSKIEHEVIVVFPDIETRDAVRAAAPKLAGIKDAGIRLEVPEFLRPSMRSLESTTFLLKKTNPALKRNLKFDDEVMDLIMDIKLTEDGQWKRIRPSEANEARKGRATPSREGSVEMDSSEIQSLFSQGPPASGANAMPMIL